MGKKKTGSTENLFSTLNKTLVPIRRFWRKYWWYVILIVGIIGFILGLVGYYRTEGDQKSLLDLLDILYSTLQLFVLNHDASGGTSWEIQIARFLLPGIAFYTISHTIMRIFRGQLKIVRIRTLHNHVVICGLGKKGSLLAKDFLAQGKRVVIIEKNEKNIDIPLREDEGATVLIGDATNEEILNKSGVGKALLLIALCGDDSTNATVAKKAHQISKESGNLKCYVHIINQKFWSLFEESRKTQHMVSTSDYRFFNIYEQGARILFQKHPPDNPDGKKNLQTESDGPIQIMVIGFGNLGESLVLQAIKSGHYLNERKLIITIVDEDIEKKKVIFRDRYNNLDKISDVEIDYVDVKMDRSGFIDTGFLSELRKNGTIYICLENDSRSLSCAFSINKNPKGYAVPIIINITQKSGFASILQSEKNKFLIKNQIFIFSPIDEACTEENIIGTNLDSIAIEIHENYVAGFGKDFKRESKPNTYKWESLWEYYKDSNRQQADHIDTKLRAINCRKTDTPKGAKVIEKINEGSIDKLAIMEHRRWVAERYLNGWEQKKEKLFEIDRQYVRLLTDGNLQNELLKVLNDKIKTYNNEIKNVDTKKKDLRELNEKRLKSIEKDQWAFITNKEQYRLKVTDENIVTYELLNIKDKKISPYLVGWEFLSESTKKYDRESVIDIPEVLKKGKTKYRIIST